MRKIITEFDVEEQIKSQENFIKRVEENLEEERKLLDSLNLIKAHIINGGYIPLKLKDLGNAYKVNYYAMPLKLEAKFNGPCIKQPKCKINVDCYNLENVLDDFVNFVCEYKGCKIGVGRHLIEKYLCSREFY